MFHQTDVRTLQPGLTPFPTDVFAHDQPWLADHLLPLIAIDLGLLRPELAGRVATLLCPIEPYEGCLGDGTEAHHTPFTSSNWLAFELDADNRLRFLGNEGYFQRAPQNRDALPVDEDLRAHAADMQDSHARARAHFQQYGMLVSGMDVDDDERQQQAYLGNLGGPFWYGNWTGYTRIPSAFVIEDLAGTTQRGTLHFRNSSDHLPDDGIRITRDGEPFFHVADVAAYNWCANGADAILMFYEPRSRTVLFTFDWS
ncbi:enolase [Stenotrophomonas sp. GZD-301]|uniref:enolase n=1 Tax=Stenotrophomonas sp. GZD-301 TaxID=3404814 RepID=UPI003BB5A8D3